MPLLKSVAHRATVMRGEGTIEMVEKALKLQKNGRNIVRMEVWCMDLS